MNILNKIKNTEADFIQVNLAEGKSNKVGYEKSQLKDFSCVNNTGVSVTAWIGKKSGKTIANNFSPELVKKAIKIAKASEELDFFYELPNKHPEKKVNKLYFGEKTKEEILEKSKSILLDLQKNEKMPEAWFEYDTSKNRVINSEGIDAEEKESMFSLNLQYIIEDKEIISNYDILMNRDLLNEEKIKQFSQDLLEETRKLKNPVKLEKKPETVILEQRALSQLLSAAFLSNFNGLNVLKERSILSNKLNEQVFSEKLILKDSGIIEKGIASSTFDDEGVETQETFLIDKGEMKNFVYDYNTAKHLNKKSTGNSSGDGIDFNNIIIESGNGLNVDEALIIKDIIGAHTANEITTDFSVKSHGTLLLERGKTKSVKDVMLSGKVIDMLNNIVSIGKEIKNFQEFYLPRIAFRGINLEVL